MTLISLIPLFLSSSLHLLPQMHPSLVVPAFASTILIKGSQPIRPGDPTQKARESALPPPIVLCSVW